jgi:hypothetical protein
LTKLLRFLGVLCVLCGSAFCLDREAFTFTNYDLNIRVEPEQQRLAVRGRISLRNDSQTLQKNLVLQISSTLNWQSIQSSGKPLQFETHQYTSDIDHTGGLTEAVVELPQSVPPKGTIDFDIGYEGVVLLDATRLTRIGVPEDRAKHIEWDQISRKFTAVRGIGYVTWYPVATEAANLSEGNSVEETVSRWKAREAEFPMSVTIESTASVAVLFSGEPKSAPKDANRQDAAGFTLGKPGIDAPTFVIAEYSQLPLANQITVQYLASQQQAAKDYADVAGQLQPVLPVSKGAPTLQILGLPDLDAASFVTRGMLLIPLKTELTNEAELAMVYAQARQSLISSRPWIQDGLAHYAQVAFIEKLQGRQAALSYLAAHSKTLVDAEKSAKVEDRHALIDGVDEIVLQTKSMYVWWMLKDMLGGSPNDALAQYDNSKDNDPAAMEHLLETSSGKNLQWFFDDWVYHDGSLPDFRIDSVFPSTLEKGGFLVTVTVENKGETGAEVPVTLKTGDSEIHQRLEVRGKSKASVRIETASAPTEVTVNDGSVPESDISNNQFKISSLPSNPSVR